MKQILLSTILMVVFNLVFGTGLALATEESQVFDEDSLVSEESLATEKTLPTEEPFRPTYTLHGSIELDIDSYFGNYPKITKENRKAIDINEAEFDSINNYYPLHNPTDPNFKQYINLDFYSNPLPDLELFISAKYGGLANSSWGYAYEKVYIKYYTDKAMYTLGRFEPEYGLMGLLLDEYLMQGLAINTLWKDTWVTGLFSRDTMTYYAEDGNNFPYVAYGGKDDLVALRFSRKHAENLLGLNLIVDGFEEGKAASFDFDGKIMDRPVTGEIAFVYPSRLDRLRTVPTEPTPGNSDPDTKSESEEDPNEDPKEDPESSEEFDNHVEFVEEGIYPKAVVLINLIENSKRMLRLAVGGSHAVFYHDYRNFYLREMEDPVIFGPNLWGCNWLYQQLLNDKWILMVNLVLTDHIDEKIFEQYQKPLPYPYPTRICGVKFKKILSATAELGLSMTYYGDHARDYGRIALNWKMFF